MIRFLVVFEKTKTGYSAFAPDLPGCISTGKTKKQAEENMFEAIQLHIEGLRAEHRKVPKATAESEMLVFA
jgi:predicted RNase H-like HicB family nuclease